MREIYATLTEHADQAQTSWGGNNPTEGTLTVGQRYKVKDFEAHSWHTKVHLEDFPGKVFNSVVFEFDPEDALDIAIAAHNPYR